MKLHLILPASLACLLAVAGAAELDTFNYVVGTQTIGASYQFTDEPLLLETARVILAMGSNTIKFRLGREYHGRQRNIPARNPAIRSLTELARDEPTHRTVLDMPFAFFVLWAEPFNGGGWGNGFAAADAEREYREMYAFACHLLKTYNGTGKAFYLGHWEGDWLLRGEGNTKDEEKITAAKINGMADWLNTRQRAVDDAKRDTPHRGVEVFHYTEVNLVKLAMAGKKTVTRAVLPKTSVDFVSYSSYDTAKSPEELRAALGFIESKLAPKPGLAGKRVFIGEYGFPSCRYSAEEQDRLSRQVMRTGLEWGCPFVLYWELFNNEVDRKTGVQRGFWMIDDKGVKQPIYRTHENLYRQARQFVAEFKAKNGRAPSAEEYAKFAVSLLP